MIEAVGLTKRYRNVLAVDDLSFTVRPGQVTGFLGPNGAGKSTTMRMMLGLDNPTRGHVLIDGQRYDQLRHPLRSVGALLEAKWVHPNRSARNHLRWMAKANDIPQRRVDEVLEQVGLTAVANKNAGGFSLGMSQRLGIAGALLGDPGILLFDEPVNGLDPEGILWIRRFMQRLASEGRTVLVSSHLLSEMSQTAEELVVIGKGKLIAQTSTSSFIDQASEAEVRVRSPRLDGLRQLLLGQGYPVDYADGALLVRAAKPEYVGELAAANGIPLQELSAQRGSLEQAFMQLTGDAVEFHTNLDETAQLATQGAKQ